MSLYYSCVVIGHEATLSNPENFYYHCVRCILFLNALLILPDVINNLCSCYTYHSMLFSVQNTMIGQQACSYNKLGFILHGLKNAQQNTTYLTRMITLKNTTRLCYCNVMFSHNPHDYLLQHLVSLFSLVHFHIHGIIR